MLLIKLIIFIFVNIDFRLFVLWVIIEFLFIFLGSKELFWVFFMIWNKWLWDFKDIKLFWFICEIKLIKFLEVVVFVFDKFGKELLIIVFFKF